MQIWMSEPDWWSRREGILEFENLGVKFNFRFTRHSPQLHADFGRLSKIVYCYILRNHLKAFSYVHIFLALEEVKDKIFRNLAALPSLFRRGHGTN